MQLLRPPAAAEAVMADDAQPANPGPGLRSFLPPRASGSGCWSGRWPRSTICASSASCLSLTVAQAGDDQDPRAPGDESWDVDATASAAIASLPPAGPLAAAAGRRRVVRSRCSYS